MVHLLAKIKGNKDFVCKNEFHRRTEVKTEGNSNKSVASINMSCKAHWLNADFLNIQKEEMEQQCIAGNVILRIKSPAKSPIHIMHSRLYQYISLIKASCCCL